MLLTLSISLWSLANSLADRTHRAASKLRHDRQALTTTEWALLVAGAAAIAIAVVAVVRTQTNKATNSIETDLGTATSFGTS